MLPEPLKMHDQTYYRQLLCKLFGGEWKYHAADGWMPEHFTSRQMAYGDAVRFSHAIPSFLSQLSGNAVPSTLIGTLDGVHDNLPVRLQFTTPEVKQINLAVIGKASSDTMALGKLSCKQLVKELGIAFSAGREVG